MRARMAWIWPGVIFALAGCAQLPKDTRSSLPPVAPLHIVIVADGAGDYRACSTSMRETVETEGWPLRVETFVWSHGYMRNVADHTDIRWSRARGQDLARIVQSHKATNPTMPVSLMGHSAGAMVVLSAAENLPPGTLDRIVLLSPSVSTQYDVKPALMATRDGMDVFYSPVDRVWLGMFTTMFGAADDPLTARTAGRFGFEPVVTPETQAIYAKLRQYQWNHSMDLVGNDGSHFGGYSPKHLSQFVLPLFRY